MTRRTKDLASWFFTEPAISVPIPSIYAAKSAAAVDLTQDLACTRKNSISNFFITQ